MVGNKSHLESTAAWHRFVDVMDGNAKSVTEHCNNQVSMVVKKNMKVLLSVIDVVVTLGRQGLPFRGHRDDDSSRKDPSNNSGNFYAMLELRARGIVLYFQISYIF